MGNASRVRRHRDQRLRALSGHRHGSVWTRGFVISEHCYDGQGETHGPRPPTQGQWTSQSASARSVCGCGGPRGRSERDPPSCPGAVELAFRLGESTVSRAVRRAWRHCERGCQLSTGSVGAGSFVMVGYSERRSPDGRSNRPSWTQERSADPSDTRQNTLIAASQRPQRRTSDHDWPRPDRGQRRRSVGDRVDRRCRGPDGVPVRRPGGVPAPRRHE